MIVRPSSCNGNDLVLGVSLGQTVWSFSTQSFCSPNGVSNNSSMKILHSADNTVLDWASKGSIITSVISCKIKDRHDLRRPLISISKQMLRFGYPFTRDKYSYWTEQQIVIN